MTGRYKAYAEYKDSDVDWLEAIPVHWDSKALKLLCSYNDEVIAENTDPATIIEYVDIGSVSAVDGISKTEKMTFGKSPSRARRIVRDGDVIISTVRTYLEAIAPISSPPKNLIASTGFAVIRPNTQLHKGFAAYCLRAKGFIREVVARSVGISYPAINASELVNIKVPCLPYVEQQKIANFLDHETAKIDTLITKQEKLIELLKEKRQAVISHAVTKGLNPQAPMKDSGVEWLGEVPQHWKVANIGRISEVKRGSGYQNIDMEVGDNTSIKMLRISDMHAIKPALIVKNNEVVKFTVSAGDILVAGTGATAGISMVVPPECSGWVHSYNSIKVKVKSNVAESEFVQLFLTSDYISKLLDVSFVGSAQPFVDTNGLKKLRVLLPPKSEQKFIVNQLKEKLLRLDAVSSRAESLISLMKERKTALISAAVTGKIDVRDWEVN